jgi:hypothetical protein
VTSGQIPTELDKDEVEKDETVAGYGQLTHEISYATITITFVKSNSTMDNVGSNLSSIRFHFASQEELLKMCARNLV